MDKKKAIEIAATYFPNYPSVNEFFVSADEQVFENKTNAENNANTLKEKDVFAVQREDCDLKPVAIAAVAAVVETAEPVVPANEAPAKPADVKAEKPATTKA